MNSVIVEQLIALNRRFYDTVAPDFAATRRRVQPGVGRALERLPDRGRWLDLGCGSGSLAVEWLRRGRQSAYLGLDFSTGLLEEARAAVHNLPGRERVAFQQADLGQPGWSGGLAGPFSGAVCFAVLHHIPSNDLRGALLAETARLLEAGALLALSVWQFQHSPKLMARRVAWERLGLDPARLEPGDTLLDWRARPQEAGAGAGEAKGGEGDPLSEGGLRSEGYPLRYVHLFEAGELRDLAAGCGFAVLDQYESDGQGGRLGLYQVWQKTGQVIRRKYLNKGSSTPDEFGNLHTQQIPKVKRLDAQGCLYRYFWRFTQQGFTKSKALPRDGKNLPPRFAGAKRRPLPGALDARRKGKDIFGVSAAA